MIFIGGIKQGWMDPESFARLIQAIGNACGQQDRDEPTVTGGRVLLSKDPDGPVLTMIRGGGRCECGSSSIRPSLTVIEGGLAERREGGS